MATKTKERTISLRTWDAKRQTGVLQITEGGKIDLYHVAKIDSDFGVAFEVDKVEMDKSVNNHVVVANYNVCLDGERSVCDCIGFERYGYCRHIQSIAALIHHGKL